MTEIPDAAVAAVMKLDIHSECQVDLCQDCIRKVLEAAEPFIAVQVLQVVYDDIVASDRRGKVGALRVINRRINDLEGVRCDPQPAPAP